MTEDLKSVWKPFEIYRDSLPHVVVPQPKLLTDQTEERTSRLQKHLRLVRNDNYKYLNDHLEIRGILRELFIELTNKLPDEEAIPEFFRNFFGQCKLKLQSKVHKHVEDIKEVRRRKQFPQESVQSTSGTSSCSYRSTFDDLPCTESSVEDFCKNIKNQCLNMKMFSSSESETKINENV